MPESKYLISGQAVRVVAADNIYKAQIYFNEFYDKMNDSERHEFKLPIIKEKWEFVLKKMNMRK